MKTIKMTNVFRFVFLQCLIGLYLTVLAAQPMVEILSAPSDTVCFGTPMALTAVVNDSINPPGYTYVWNTAATVSSIFPTPGTTTTYTVTVTQTSSSETASATVTIVVNPLPTANAGANQNICGGTAYNFNASASGGTSPYSFTWSNGVANGTSVVLNATGTFTVTVTDNKGCTDTDDVTITVAGPNVTAVSNPTEICAGKSATITASASGNISYSWSTGQSGNSISVSPSITTTYTVTATNNAGCATTATAAVVVNPNPLVNLGGDPTICQMGSVTVNVAVNSGTMPYNTYAWSDGGSGSSRSLSPSNTTNYTVTVTDNKNCTGTDDVTVNVRPKPTANAGTAVSVCAGESTTLNGSGSTGQGQLSFQWSNGQTGVTTSVAPTTQTTYTLTVTDGNNCTDTATITVSIKLTPTAQISAVPVNPRYCIGGNIQLNGSATGGGNGATYTYTWTGPAGFSSSNQNISILAATLPMAGLYTLTATSKVNNVVGCSDTAQLNVTVLNDPSVTISGGNPVCAGGNLNLSAQIVNGAGTPTYSWEKSTGTTWMPIQNSNSNTLNTGGLTTDTKFRVRTIFAPASLDCNEAVSDSVIIKVISQPMPTIRGDTVVCAKGRYFYTVSDSLDILSASQFTWTIPNGGVEIARYANGAIILIEWQSAGSKILKVEESISALCKGTATKSVNVSGSPQAPNPAMIKLFAPNNILICKDSSSTCYQWGYIGPNAFVTTELSGEIYQAYGAGNAYEAGRDYFVKTWNSTDCTAPATCYTISRDIEIAGNLTSVTPRLHLYPNPNTGAFQVEVSRLKEAEYTLVINDVLGRIIQQKQVQVGTDGLLNEAVQLDGAANGLYYVALRHDKGTLLAKAVSVYK